VSVGCRCVWVVHESGRCYFRIGVQSPKPPHNLSPVWIDIDQPSKPSQLRRRWEVSRQSDVIVRFKTVRISPDDHMVGVD